jgi:hypothetical protein
MRLFRRRRKPTEASTYWNTSVIQRIERDAGVDRDTAAAWFREMLRFLDLVADSREFLSPPRSVDVAWHAFILHTRDYESYCRERYGRVIHHQPTGEPDPGAYQRAYERRSRDREPINHGIWDAPPGLGIGLATGAIVGGSHEDEEDDEHGSSGGAWAPSGAGDYGDSADGGSSRGDSSDGGSSGGDAGGGSSCGSSCGGGGCGGGGG